MTRRLFMTLMFGVLFTISAVPALAHDDVDVSESEVHVASQLARVRAATAKYHDVDAAIADGYFPVGECTQIPGVGAMGIHYVNINLAMNATIDPLRPELPLYAPTADGPRLVGVEYFVSAALVDETPTVFGRPLDGPMAGHEPGQPEHYDLHVWLWKHNPDDMFAQYNPTVHCDE